MKNILLIALVCISTITIAQKNLHYKNYVNDFANVMTNEQESKLNKKISDFEKSTEIQIAVVTVKSLEGRSVDGFTNDLFNQWGVGSKERNDGLMLLIAPNERKWRTEVGYGLEKWLTDGYTKVEAEHTLPKNFKKKDYYGGIDPLITTFIDKMGTNSWAERDQIAKEEAIQAKIDAEKSAERSAKAWSVFVDVISVLGILLTIILIIVYSVKRHKRLKREAVKLARKIEKGNNENRNTIENFRSKLKHLASFDKNRDFSGMYKYLDKAKHTLEHSDTTTLEGIEEACSVISDQISYELVKISQYVHEYETLDKIKRFSEAGIASSDIKGIQDDMEKFIVYNMSHEYSIPFYRDSVLKFLKLAQAHSEMVDANLDINNIKELTKEYEDYQTAIEAATRTLRKHKTHLYEHENAKSYMQKKFPTSKSMIEEMNKAINQKDVISSTKKRAKKAASNMSTFSPDYSKENILTSYALFISLIEAVDLVKARANSDVQEAENDRRIKKEDEERRARRRRQASYSSSSSYVSSSSGSSFGGFGGGMSGGGGSSGSW